MKLFHGRRGDLAVHILVDGLPNFIGPDRVAAALQESDLGSKARRRRRPFKGPDRPVHAEIVIGGDKDADFIRQKVLRFLVEFRDDSAQVISGIERGNPRVHGPRMPIEQAKRLAVRALLAECRVEGIHLLPPAGDPVDRGEILEGHAAVRSGPGGRVEHLQGAVGRDEHVGVPFIDVRPREFREIDRVGGTCVSAAELAGTPNEKPEGGDANNTGLSQLALFFLIVHISSIERQAALR